MDTLDVSIFGINYLRLIDFDSYLALILMTVLEY